MYCVPKTMSRAISSARLPALYRFWDGEIYGSALLRGGEAREGGWRGKGKRRGRPTAPLPMMTNGFYLYCPIMVFILVA